MELLFHIPSEKVKVTYNRVRQLLNGRDNIIFAAMVHAIQNTAISFTPPTVGSTYDINQVHQEIERLIDFMGSREGPIVAIKLMDETLRLILSAGGIPSIDNESLFKAASFQTSQDVILRPNQDLHWHVSWKMNFQQGMIKQRRIIALDLYRKGWGIIVPNYITQYINGAISLYNNGMTAASVSLLSIAVEATLRDILEAHNYTYIQGASPVDVYTYTEASVSTDGNSYTIQFNEPMPLSVVDFLQSTGGTNRCTIRVRRLEQRSGRSGINILAPNYLVDHWSTNRVERNAEVSVTGLGAAFRIARTNNILLASEFPIDLDNIIAAIRNSLIHLSGAALNRSITSPSGITTTLQDFLKDSVRVYDLVTSIPAFINEQYIKLRRSGHIHP